MTPYRWLFGCIALLAFGVLQFNLPNLGNNLILEISLVGPS